MGAFWVDPTYPRAQLEADRQAAAEGELHLVEAWPGSVTTREIETIDGGTVRSIDGVATRILGSIPQTVIAVGLWLIPESEAAGWPGNPARPS